MASDSLCMEQFMITEATKLTVRVCRFRRNRINGRLGSLLRVFSHVRLYAYAAKPCTSMHRSINHTHQLAQLPKLIENDPLEDKKKVHSCLSYESITQKCKNAKSGRDTKEFC